MTNHPEPSSGIKTLINYVEFWKPVNESLVLETSVILDSDQARSLPATNQTIAKGQGIAGSAWQQEDVVIMQGSSAILEELNTKTGVAVKALIAIPVYCEFTLLNVVVLGISEGNAGLEIWKRDDRDELSVSGSYYDGLSCFEFISRYVRFPKGAGLPGSCWKTGRPRIIDAPSQDPDFIRSFDRDPADPQQCIGLPLSREYGYPASILLLLSDLGKPLAKHIDILKCESDGDAAKFKSSHSGGSESWRLRLVDSIGMMQTAIELTGDSDLLPERYHYGIAIPFFANKQVEDVFVMLF